MTSIPDRSPIRHSAASTGVHSPVDVALDTQGTAGAVVHTAITGLTLAAAAAGFKLDGAGVTLLCCGAILLLGLPHGALDMLGLLRSPRRVRAVGFYLALAGATAALWWAIPGAALLLFFAMAIGHFSEDWPGPGLIANGSALALLAAPVVLHRGVIDALFAVIVDGAIPPLAVALLLLAPVAIAAGLTSCALLWNAGRPVRAVSSAAALAGALWLPPLVGFALAFGLFHSPRQFARGVEGIAARQWRKPVAAASLASLLLVALIAGTGAPDFSAGMLRGTFIVLSVLTVPHMLMPLILRWARYRRHG